MKVVVHKDNTVSVVSDSVSIEKNKQPNKQEIRVDGNVDINNVRIKKKKKKNFVAIGNNKQIEIQED